MAASSGNIADFSAARVRRQIGNPRAEDEFALIRARTAEVRAALPFPNMVLYELNEYQEVKRSQLDNSPGIIDPVASRYISRYMKNLSNAFDLVAAASGISAPELNEAIEKYTAEKGGSSTIRETPHQVFEGENAKLEGDDPGYNKEESRRMVAVDSVIRVGSSFSAIISIMSILATVLSGAIIIQPAIAFLMLISSVGFYCMTLVKE
jgi:hypothetical protein